MSLALALAGDPRFRVAVERIWRTFEVCRGCAEDVQSAGDSHTCLRDLPCCSMEAWPCGGMVLWGCRVDCVIPCEARGELSLNATTGIVYLAEASYGHLMALP